MEKLQSICNWSLGRILIPNLMINPINNTEIEIYLWPNKQSPIVRLKTFLVYRDKNWSECIELYAIYGRDIPEDLINPAVIDAGKFLKNQIYSTHRVIYNGKEKTLLVN